MKFITKALMGLLLLVGSAFATTTVSGTLRDLGTSTSGTFVRFYLRGCSGNQPRVGGAALISPTGSGVFYKDLSASSGSVSGTLYSTRDAAGTGNGEIECGGSLLAVWYGMVVFRNGIAGPETPIHAKNGVALDITTVTPITTSPVTTAPSGDGTYARIDTGNLPFLGLVTARGFANRRIYDTGWYSGLGAMVSDTPAGGLFYVPDNQTIATATATTINKNISGECPSKRSSTLQTTAGVNLFTGSGTVKDFLLKNCFLDGNNAGLSALSVPDFGGGNDWSNGAQLFENMRVMNWTGTALDLGQSVYWTHIIGSRFENNARSFKSKWASDFRISRSEFELPRSGTTLPQVEFMCGSSCVIDSSDFETRSGVCQPDIYIDADAPGGASGFGKIVHNKFGPENDCTNRDKVYVASRSATPNTNVYGMYFAGNDFSAVGGGVAITGFAVNLQNPIAGWRFVANRFGSYPVLINDAHSNRTNSGGHNYFGCDNSIELNGGSDPSPTNSQVKLFSNYGRGFDFICEIGHTADNTLPVFPWSRHLKETTELRNRLAYSEAIGSWTKNVGTETITCGQADRDGGTTACNITDAGAATNDGVQISISMTGARASGFFIEFDCQDTGSLKTLHSGVWDSTDGAFVDGLHWFTCGTEAKRHKFVVRGINTGHSYSLFVYPGSAIRAEAGTIRVGKFQVSDFDSDYIATNGSAAVDTNNGSNFQNGVLIQKDLTMAGANSTFIGNVAITISSNSATPSVAQGNFFIISNGSATTITNFTNGRAGQRITLLFGNTNTKIQNGSNIKLVGGQDITGQTNQILEFVFTTVWTQTDHSAVTYVQDCGSTTTCSAAQNTVKIVRGTVALSSGTPSTATVTGFSPAFSGTNTYNCTVTNETTQANPLKYSRASSSSITITGPNTVTDTVSYICIGT